MLAKETKELTDPVGTFGYANKDMGWFFIYDEETKTYMQNVLGKHVFSCREYLSFFWRKGVYGTQAFDNTNNNWIGFNFTGLDIEKLNEFWKPIEEKLSLDKKTFFYRTNLNPQTIVMKVPPFWMENNFKKGVFSLLLRLAIVYGTNLNLTYDAAVQKYSLAKCVKPMLDYFLDGNTKIDQDIAVELPTSRTTGIITEFNGISVEQIKQRLTKP